MPTLKIKQNGVWQDVAAPAPHTHNITDINGIENIGGGDGTDLEARAMAQAAQETADNATTVAETVNTRVDEIIPLTKYALGNDLTLSDDNFITTTIGANRIENVTVHGKTKQFTTTGKNLLPNMATSQTINGVTFTVNADGSVTVNGQATSYADFYFYGGASDTGNYLFVPKGSKIWENKADGCLWIAREKTAGNLYLAESINNLLAERDCYFYGVLYRAEPEATLTNHRVYGMIMPNGVTDSTYEPYTGGIPSPNPDYPQPITGVGEGGSTTVYVSGKNLLPNAVKSVANNGITFTANSDGSVTIDGTATAQAICRIAGSYDGTAPVFNYKAGTTYMISTHATSYGSLALYSRQSGEWKTVIQSSSATHKFIPTEDGYVTDIFIYVRANTTIDNVTVYPQIEIGSIATDYEPYRGNTYTLPLAAPLYEGDTVESNAASGLDKRIVLTGEEAWKLNANYASTFNCNALTPANLGMADGGDILCDRYPYCVSGADANRSVCGMFVVSTINIKDSRCATVDEWKAYLAAQYAAGTPVTLWYKSTAGDDGLRVCKETHTRKRLVLNGTETLLTFTVAGNYYRASIRLPVSAPTVASGLVVQNVISSHHATVDWNTIYNGSRNDYVAINWDGSTVGFSTTCTTADEWKAYLAAQYAAGTPVAIVYELAEPEVYAHEAVEMENASGNVIINGENTISASFWPVASLGDLKEFVTSSADQTARDAAAAAQETADNAVGMAGAAQMAITKTDEKVTALEELGSVVAYLDDSISEDGLADNIDADLLGGKPASYYAPAVVPYEQLNINDIFTALDGHTIDVENSVVYRKGERMFAKLLFVGSITSSTAAATSACNIVEGYRPLVRKMSGCLVNINTDSGQTVRPATSTIYEDGRVMIAFPSGSTTYGNGTRPWCTNVGLSLEWEIG